MVDVDGKELIMNTEISEKDFIYVNRIGKVIDTPLILETDILPGDEVIVHHNVFRRWYDMRGVEKNSGSYYKNDQYFVSESEIFAYKRDKDWVAVKGYCFVEPINHEDMWSVDPESPNIGKLTYHSEMQPGRCGEPQIVGFTPDSEYEFNIDGKKLYRVLDNQITFTYGL